MKTLSERLKFARKEAKLSQANLGKLSGISQGAIGMLETGQRDGSTSIAQIAQALGVDPIWLSSGKGKMRPSTLPADWQNTSPADLPQNRIPILSSVQAGEWVVSNIADELSEHTNWLDFYTGKWKPTLYALRVDGASMTDNGSRLSFPSGGHIVCDPEQGVSSGQFCIAKDTTSQGTVFKRYDTDGFTHILTSLNSQYDPIPINDGRFRIIARVLEYIPATIKL